MTLRKIINTLLKLAGVASVGALYFLSVIGMSTMRTDSLVITFPGLCLALVAFGVCTIIDEQR